MVGVKKQIAEGELLLEEFSKLDSRILDQQLTQDNFTYNTLIDDVVFFNQEAEKFIDNAREAVDSKRILFGSRQHEYVNDFEVDSPALRKFYSYGIAIKQVIDESQRLIKGAPKTRREFDGHFHYDADEGIIYRNNVCLRIKSRQLKSTTLCKVVFKHKYKWVNATDIDDERAEELGGLQYEEDEPYEWIRKACDKLNKQIKEKFRIEYNLFEKENQKVRLNPLAK